MNFLHFTNWKIEEIKIGTPYSTSWDKSNYWIQKTKNGNSIPQDIASLLNAMPEIKIQGLGLDIKEILKSFKIKSELLKEYIFDEVRLEIQPSAPSRKKCMYLFDNTYDYKKYAELLSFELSNYNLLEIEPISEKFSYIKTDFSFLNCNVENYNSIRENAIKYWNGEIHNQENCEILFQGDFIIKNVLHKKII